MRLLVTEKDPLVRQWLRFNAEKLDVQLVYAYDTEEAMAAVREKTPDCVFLDVCSSTDDTVPLWYLLRCNPYLPPQVPILLYSSSRHWQGVAEQESLAVDGYVCSPFTLDVLVRAAREATSLRQTVAPPYTGHGEVMQPQGCA